MAEHRKAVVLVNLGSPASCRTGDVRTFLKEFLGDPYVIDLPAWIRYPLVYGIIAPFRAPRSARLYKQLHTDRGFPLIYHSRELEKKVREQLPRGTELFLAMRYGEPALQKLIQWMKGEGYRELLVLPLYPQFATSTTGSVVQLFREELKFHKLAEHTRIIPSFHEHRDFIAAWKNKILACEPADYDALVFSYHGIPVRQTEKGHPGASCGALKCEQHYNEANRDCYRAACYHTTRSIRAALKIAPEKTYTSFQSRFGRNWLRPFTDQTLLKLVREGKKRILIISPAFVADCLETEIEIGLDYRELFTKAGGKELTLVPSLNADDDWVRFISSLISDPGTHSLKLGETDQSLFH